MLTPEADLYLAPETRCLMWGHIFRPHELLGSVCIRCGKAAPVSDIRNDQEEEPS